jgi:hypothetical protein
MAITLDDMINEMVLNLSGYTINQDRATHLTQAVSTLTSSSAVPTVLKLGSTENIGKGLIEIDEELMYLDSFDRINTSANVAPWGRGFLGTAAATHLLDAKVTIAPTFPRFSVKRSINDSIRGVRSSIMAVKNTTFVYNAAVNTYAFNNLGIQNILFVQWQTLGPSKEWAYLHRWNYDSDADATAFGAGAQTITLTDRPVSGRTVKITYATNPVVLANNADDFSTVTGLPESTKDVIMLGAMWRLLLTLDPARSAMVSPQADETNSKRPFGSGGTMAKQIYAMYMQRLNEEVQQQQQIHPVRSRFNR